VRPRQPSDGDAETRARQRQADGLDKRLPEVEQPPPLQVVEHRPRLAEPDPRTTSTTANSARPP
jgi:hypothetical protein